MKKSVKNSRFSWEQIKDFCETLTEAEDQLTREMVSRISDKWSLWTMSVIAELRRPMRFEIRPYSLCQSHLFIFHPRRHQI